VLIAMFEPKEDRLGLQSSSASQAKANGKRKASEFEDHSMDFGGWCYVGSHNFSSAAWVCWLDFAVPLEGWILTYCRVLSTSRKARRL
jgi:hypothetical protein